MGNSYQKNEIAIIGMGCYYPGASNLTDLWENIVSRREEFRTFPDERLPVDKYSDLTQSDSDKSYVTQGTFIDGFEFDWMGYRIPKKTVESSDIVHWLTYEIAFRALKDAGYTKENIPKDKTGVIIGNTLTGEQTRASYIRQRWPFVEKVMRASAKDLNLTPKQTEIFVERSKEYYKSVFPEMTEDSLAGGLANTIAGRVCNAMDLHGGGFTVDGACSSSLIAISTASEKLSSGTLDIAIAGGVDISLDTFEMVGFARTGALTPTQMRVYDRRGNGFMPGEGCGIIVMKRLEDAKRDGDRVYATIKGWGISSDGKGGITAPSGIYQGLALDRAYQMAGYSAEDLDFIEGHGTGTTVGDREELKGISINVGHEPNSEGLRRCGVTSFKSIVGHTKAASGVGGLIKATLALNQRVTPPTAGCEQNNLFFDKLIGRGIYPITLGKVHKKETILRAGVSAMGFGGINTHITLESTDTPSVSIRPSIPALSLLASSQKSEIYPLEANSITALISTAMSLKTRSLGMSIAELPDLALECSQKIVGAKVRATIITQHPKQLQKQIQALIEYLQNSTIKEGERVEIEKNKIVLSFSLNQHNLGFIFPGQGSQQLNMAYNLVRRFKWAREMLDQAEEILVEAGWRDKSLSDYIFKETDRAIDEDQKKQWLRELTDTNIAQPAICFASALWNERLRRLGLTAKVVGGHSLGELSAFYSAGAFNFEELMRLSALRGDAMHNTPSQGGMVAMMCSKEEVERVIKSVKNYITIANINTPSQIVLSGEEVAIEEIIQIAQQEGIKAKKLKVSNAFHSRLMDSASARVKEECRLPHQLSTKTKIISTSSTEETTLPEYFSKQILSQVDFVSLVDQMQDECDMLVEVGTGSVLSSMVSRITENIPTLAVESTAMDDLSLNRVLAEFFIAGGVVKWDELYHSRLVRPFIVAKDKLFIRSHCENPFVVSPTTKEMQSTFVTSIDKSSSSPAPLTEVIHALQVINDSKIVEALQLLNGSENIQTIQNSKTVESPILEESEEPKEIIENIVEEKTKDTLLKIIEEMTGFPIESLDMDLKLLDDLNLDSIKATELISQVSQELNLEITIDPAPLANATLDELVEILEGLRPIDSSIDDAPVSNQEQIKGVLLKNIETITGFPIDSLELDLRLLDDLNLDSIKATELIAQTSQMLELNIEIDPAPLANSTLQEIINIILSHKENLKSTPNVPKERPQNGKNRINPKIDKKIPWVRNFILELNEKPIEAIDKKWIIDKKILIISTREELGLIESLNRDGVEDITVSSFETAKNLPKIEFDIIFFILPQYSNRDSKRESFFHMVERLHTISKIKGSTTICFVQFTGGSFGVKNLPNNIESSSSLAWASSLHLEQKKLKIRVVDFDKKIKESLFVDKIVDEISTDKSFDLAGYDREGRRYSISPKVHEPKLDKKSSIVWEKDDVIVVTGGAKGITAECALAFAKDTRVKMALIGRSKLSKEIEQTIRRFEEDGLEVKYYSCDIVDREKVALTVKDIETTLGDIRGVIHGSALNSPASLGSVSLENAKKEISPKVLGAINILESLEGRSLKLLVGLTSIIGVSGMIGNGWYGFSNELLDTIFGSYGVDNPDTKIVSTAFSVWGEVGMGERMGSTNYLEKMGIMAIPVKEGIERFSGLLQNEAPTRQVVITAKLSGLDTWNAPKCKKPYSNRFIEEVIYQHFGVETQSRVHLTLEKDPYLKDHVWNGSNLFPTVFGLEAMAQNVSFVTGIEVFKNLKIEEIKLEKPIVAHPQRGIRVQINTLVLERKNQDEPIRVKVTISTEHSNFERPHFSAIFVLNGAKNLGLEGREGLPEFPQKRLDIDIKKEVYSWLLFQGSLFQRLESFYRIDNEHLIFETTSHKGEEREWILGSPYVRDSLLQSAQPMFPHNTCLPIYIKSLTISDTSTALPNKIKGIIIGEELENKEYRTDVSTLSPDGSLLEKMEGYRLKILDNRTEFPEDKFWARPKIVEDVMVQEKIEELSDKLGIEKPELKVIYIPSLSQMKIENRHKRVKPIVEEWLQKSGGERATLEWREDGKPLIKERSYDISISHKNSYLLISKERGCDIESITHRSLKKWKIMLNLSKKENRSTIDLFQTHGDSLDIAGTRLWAIKETLFKAVGESQTMDIVIKSIYEDSMLLEIKSDKESVDMITTLIELKRGGRKMLTTLIKRDQHVG